jgi:hypothetical protein
VSGPSGLDVGDRRGCLKACTPDDPDEYPVLVEPEMDIYLVEVSCAVFRVCFFVNGWSLLVEPGIDIYPKSLLLMGGLCWLSPE